MGGRCRALGEERSPRALSQDPSPRLGLGSSCVTTPPPPTKPFTPPIKPTNLDHVCGAGETREVGKLRPGECQSSRSLGSARVQPRVQAWAQFSSVAQSCLTLCDSMNARQASLSITNSRSSLKLTSIKSVMPSSHLILCRPLLLLPPIPPSITVFSNESTLRMRWPKNWSFSFSIIPSKEHPGTDLL